MSITDIRISDFVEKERRYLTENCNFTDDELKYFEMKVKDASDVQVHMSMNVSLRKVSDLSRRVKAKIIKVAVF